jgi:hypothetical protein
VRVFSILAALILNGCIAGKAGYYLVETEKAYTAAEEAGAEELAVYEFTLATAYRAKAWEEAGYSDYGPAEAYAIKASAHAQAAQKIAETGAPTRNLMEELEADQAVLPELVDRSVEPEAEAVEVWEELGEAPEAEPEPEPDAFELEDEPEEAEGLDWLLDELEEEQ